MSSNTSASATINININPPPLSSTSPLFYQPSSILSPLSTLHSALSIQHSNLKVRYLYMSSNTSASATINITTNPPPLSSIFTLFYLHSSLFPPSTHHSSL